MTSVLSVERLGMGPMPSPSAITYVWIGDHLLMDRIYLAGMDPSCDAIRQSFRDLARQVGSADPLPRSMTMHQNLNSTFVDGCWSS